MNKPLYYYTSLFAWGVVFFLIIFYAFAWNPPVDNPPNANLPAPINTSSVEQTKAGNLNLDNNLKVGGLLRLGLYTSHPTGTNGNLYYNTSDHKFYGYQNNEWKELGGGAGFWLASGDNIYNTNTGNVGIGTTSPGAKLDVNGDIKIKYPGIKLQTDSDGDLWITANAYYDGSNWQRENTSQESFGIEMMRAGNIIYESMPGVVIWRAVPGSNPIGPFTTYGGWEANLISTYYRDLVVGGAVIEIDGNGLLPYGRLIHSNPSGNIYTGIGRNIYGDFSGRDKTDQPSWFSGFANDTFTVKRAPSGSSVNFTDFLNITNSGNVGIGTTGPSRKLFVNGDAGGTTGWYNDSDARLKTNVQTIPNALEKVEKMRGVNFEWIDTENHPKGLQVGFIAQELKDVLPEVVDKKGEYYSVQESSITAVLVEAIKEQQKEIENQQKQIEDLKAQIETLKNY